MASQLQLINKCRDFGSADARSGTAGSARGLGARAPRRRRQSPLKAIDWLRAHEGDEAAKRLLAWATGVSLTVIAYHARVGEPHNPNRIDHLLRSSSALIASESASRSSATRSARSGASRSMRYFSLTMALRYGGC